ncbi:hypothetical protein PVK06_019649 [Gossypium arboreum]|uniref:MATH domain-containing protein n=1 Tax=Gossypium arboreum TaxID=29729 RepID=A0ABR0PKK8_GOSAR|nr:hypothetical protein PVK06_019649 [Gossypium arboreum]
MTEVPTAQGLSFLPFSNGYENGVQAGDDTDHYLSELRRRGKEAIFEFITSSKNERKPSLALSTPCSFIGPRSWRVNITSRHLYFGFNPPPFFASTIFTLTYMNPPLKPKLMKQTPSVL